jgi:phage major head subunit gpT-like protein
MTAYNGGKLAVGNFPHQTVIAMDGVELHGGSETLPILRDHDTKQPVGHGTAVIASDSLQVSGTISQTTDAANSIVEAARNGFQWQASVGGKLTKPPEFIKAGKTVNVNGREIDGPVYLASGFKWVETSITAIGADEDRTSVDLAANHSTERNNMNPKLKDFVIEAGFDPDELEQSQLDFFEAQLAAKEPAKAPPKSRTLDDVIAKESAKAERENKITQLTASAISQNPGNIESIKALAEIAIEAEWDSERFELELLRNLRAAPTLSFSAGASRKQAIAEDVLEAAFSRSAGLNDVEAEYKEETLEAADKSYRDGLGIKQLLFIAAQANGYHDTSYGRQITREVLEYAFAEQSHVRASNSFSTVSLPNILSNVANKFVREGFNSVDSAWRQITATRSVTDFKQITTNSLVGDFKYQEMTAGSNEIEHAVPGEVTYTNQATTYARMIGISRRDLTNDDTNALSATGRKLGRGGALKMNEVFWAKFLDNATFFSAGNNNVATGAGSALSLDGEALNAAEQLFWDQTDPDGNPLGSSPAILLVPTVLHNTALRLMNSSAMVGGTDPTVGDANVYQGRYRVVTSPYLSNATLTGYSATAWYLLANPADLPVIECVFLNGRDTPVVESAAADFNQLGISMRGYGDFGCELQEYRGGVRSAGA